MFHPEYEHLFTSDLFVTPTAKRYDDQDSETLRGCFCVKHFSPVLHVLEDIAQHFSDPQQSWDQRNPY